MNLKNTIITGFKMLKDKSMEIRLVTRELSPEQLAELVVNFNQEVLAIDIPDDYSENKSPSQRQRAILYKVWETNSEIKNKFSTFVLYYQNEMEKINNFYKEKIQ